MNTAYLLSRRAVVGLLLLLLLGIVALVVFWESDEHDLTAAPTPRGRADRETQEAPQSLLRQAASEEPTTEAVRPVPSAGDATTEIGVTTPDSELICLRIKVVGLDGAPIERITVSYVRRELAGSGAWGNTQSTDKQGMAFMKKMLPKVEYWLSALPQSLEEHQQFATTGMPYTWDGESLETVVLQLNAGVTIEGVVEAERFGLNEDFAISQIEVVSLEHDDPARTSDVDFWTGGFQERASGRWSRTFKPSLPAFRYTNLLPGKTQVAVKFSIGLILRSKVIETEAGKTYRAEFDYPLLAHIRGKVRWSDGTPFEKGVLRLATVRGDLQGGVAVPTDDQGSYHFLVLHPGTYYLVPGKAMGASGRDWTTFVDDWDRHQVSIERGAEITHDLVVRKPWTGDFSVRLTLGGVAPYTTANGGLSGQSSMAVSVDDLGVFTFKDFISQRSQKTLVTLRKRESNNFCPDKVELWVPIMSGHVERAYPSSSLDIHVAIPEGVNATECEVWMQMEMKDQATFTHEAKPDAEGKLHIEHLPHGEYRVLLSTPNRPRLEQVYQHNDVGTLELTPGQTGGTIELTLAGFDGEQAGTPHESPYAWPAVYMADETQLQVRWSGMLASVGQSILSKPLVPGDYTIRLFWIFGNYETVSLAASVRSGETTRLSVWPRGAAECTFTMDGLPDNLKENAKDLDIQIESPRGKRSWVSSVIRAPEADGSYRVVQILKEEGLWTLYATLSGCKSIIQPFTVTMNVDHTINVDFVKE